MSHFGQHSGEGTSDHRFVIYNEDFFGLFEFTTGGCCFLIASTFEDKGGGISITGSSIIKAAPVSRLTFDIHFTIVFQIIERDN